MDELPPASRGGGSVPGATVEPAPGSGDDVIVARVREAAGRTCVVVTADREHRRKVEAHGARRVGPRAVRPAEPAQYRAPGPALPRRLCLRP
jgi:hypothetical protein